jgi:hypothetical protein
MPTPPLSKWQQRQALLMRVSAPADQYFGRMKMSYLGINNTFRDARISTGSRTTSGAIITKVELADDALRAWARLYPKDPQLPRSYFLAADLFRRIWVKSYQERAWQYMQTIATLFPATYFGKQVRKELAIGYTEHYYADPLPCATPTPYPEPPIPTVPVQETATAEPSTGPSPSPVPTRGPSGPAVQIETPPCIPPATPTPEPTLTPTPEVTPSPETAASPEPSPSEAPTLSPAPMPTSSSPPGANNRRRLREPIPM